METAKTGASDKILLKGMRFYGRHGVLPAERELGQWFETDVEITLDLSRAGKSDSLEDTLNYAELYLRIKERMEGPPCALIESLAAALIRICFAFSQVEKVRVRVKKLNAPLEGHLQYAAVEMERRRGEE